MPDEARAAKNAEIIKAEGKGMFASFDESKVVDCLLAGPPAETRLLAELYISDALAGGGTGGRRLCANEELVRMGVAKHYDGGTKEAWRDEELRTIAGE